LAATASYAADVAAWMRAGRRDLAHEVAAALGSMEAVRVRGGPQPAGAQGLDAATVTAAAAIGASVLAVADRQAAAAEAVAERWAARLADLPFRPPAQAATSTGATTRVPL
jgi:siderophore synthetase component